MVHYLSDEEHELEKLAVERVNQLLSESEPDPGYRLKYCSWLSQPVYIDGNCIGRRQWDSTLHYVRAVTRGVWDSSVAKLYRPLYPLWDVTSVEELVVRLDLMLALRDDATEA